jgi:hypothetical protein
MPAAPASSPAPASIAEPDLAAAWAASLAAHPPAPRPYDKPRRAALRWGGYAATVFQARSASGLPAAQRQVQLTYLRFRAGDLGFSGLSLRARGRLEQRYDQNPDRFLPGEHTMPLVQELGVHYATPAPGFSASLGRFLPLARFAGKIDGAEVAAAGKTLTLTGYGGFKPSLQRLEPRSDPVAGVALILERQDTASPWSLTTGYLREYAQTALSRQAVAMDAAASYRGRVWLTQAALLDLPRPGAAGGLSEVSVHGAATVNGQTSVSTGLRFTQGRIDPLEAAQYPQGWLPYLEARSQTRADADARFDLGGLAWLRPYAYWQRDLARREPFSRITALGLGYHRETLWGYAVAVDAGGDVGHGTREQAGLECTLASTGEGWFGWTAGHASRWTYRQASGLHTFSSLLRLGTVFRLPGGLRLSVEGQSALASALAATPAPVPAYHRGDAGVSYVW